MRGSVSRVEHPLVVVVTVTVRTEPHTRAAARPAAAPATCLTTVNAITGLPGFLGTSPQDANDLSNKLVLFGRRISACD